MHDQRTVRSAVALPAVPAWSDRVRGLGICDALQLVVELSQLPCLRDELDELRIAHEQGVTEATSRAGSPRATVRASARVDLEHHRDELAVLRAIREQVPAEASSSV